MRARFLAVVAGLALAAAACGGETTGKKTETGGAKPLAGQKIEVAAKWTGTEQANFQGVLKAFEAKTGATVTYAATGENTAEFLGPRIEQKNPPDVAILPQPGLVQEYATKGALKPLTSDVLAEIDKNYSPYWKDLGSADGKVYGVMAKAAYKSSVWYRTAAFDKAGVQPPQTFDELATKTAQTLSDSGETPFSLCGASGWSLTDWFENVYLSQAGPQKYDQLAKHEIPWTDPSVTTTLQSLAKIWGKPNFLVDGTNGALQTDFPTCVTKVFGQNKGAIIYEADFVAATIGGDTKAKVGTDAKVFPFPAAGNTKPVVLGGDIAVALKDNQAAMEFMKFLASPEAATVWAKPGGYLSANKNVAPDVYPDALTKQFAQDMVQNADSARYDMSDLAPSAFGGTDGKGEWKLLQDFLRNPADVKGIQAKLEAEAKATFKK